jgi:hypothetical protein
MDSAALSGVNVAHVFTPKWPAQPVTGAILGECVSCHMPAIEQTLGDVNVHAHTFRFITPADTETLKIPNACNQCHADKSIGWAMDVLKSWTERSPWRMEN